LRFEPADVEESAADLARPSGLEICTVGRLVVAGQIHGDRLLSSFKKPGISRYQSHALPPHPWISANVPNDLREIRPGCHDGLVEPCVRLAILATVYTELHNPQSELRHQRVVKLFLPPTRGRMNVSGGR
jgi:hypothetical protein